MFGSLDLFSFVICPVMDLEQIVESKVKMKFLTWHVNIGRHERYIAHGKVVLEGLILVVKHLQKEIGIQYIA